MKTDMPESIYTFLAGAWIMVNNSITFPNGSYRDPMLHATGPHPVGLIHYSVNGYMSANIMATTPTAWRPAVNYSTATQYSEHDWAMVGQHTMSYAGPFSIDKWSEDGLSGLVIHGGKTGLTFSGAPGWVGDRQARNFTVIKGAWKEDVGNGKGKGKDKEEGADLLKITFWGNGWPTTGLLGTLFWRRGPKTF